MGRRDKSNRLPDAVGEGGCSAGQVGAQSRGRTSGTGECLKGEGSPPHSTVDPEELAMARFILEHGRIFF